MDEIVKEQILRVRDTGLTNMFDAEAVQRIAEALHFAELADYLKKHRGDLGEYVGFIITGKTEARNGGASRSEAAGEADRPKAKRKGRGHGIH